jgi:hypothetical protein
MDKRLLLEKLPPFSNRSTMIKKNQTVNDIVREVLTAHEIFAPDYDAIVNEFNQGSPEDIAYSLFQFIKRNVRYEIEPETMQTTKSPAAILTTGKGDCKHYSGFIAGVLDALKRSGKKINWFYRFASYSFFDTQPGHVFVVVEDQGREIWVDAVLKNFDERLQPAYILDKKVNTGYMLNRVSGVGLVLDDGTAVSNLVFTAPDLTTNELYQIAQETGDEEISPEITKATAVLYRYGIMNDEGKVNDDVLTQLSNTLPVDEWEEVANARIAVQTAAINGFFGDIWNGVKKVTLAIPRNAYLSLVRLNVFGFGTKLGKLLYRPDGSYDWANEKKLADKWRSLGGSWGSFKSAIQGGMKKKAVIGEVEAIGAAPAVPAWIATAGAIILALKPLIESLLKARAQEAPNMYPYGVCDDGFTPRNPDGSCTSYTPPSTGGGIMDFIKNNPVVVVGVGAGLAYYLTKKRRP